MFWTKKDQTRPEQQHVWSAKEKKPENSKSFRMRRINRVEINCANLCRNKSYVHIKTLNVIIAV